MHPSMPQVLVWFCLCPLFRGVNVRTWDELPVQSCLYRERPPSHLYPITNLFYPLGRFLSSYSIRCLRSLTLLCLSSVVVQVFLQSLLVWFQVNFLKFWSCNARVHLVPVLPAHCLLVYSIFFHPHWALAWNLSHALPSPSHFSAHHFFFLSLLTLQLQTETGRRWVVSGTQLQLLHAALLPPLAKTKLTLAHFSCHLRQFYTSWWW